MLRPILSVAAGAAVAAVGAAVLGEYAFDGLAVIGSAVVLGLFVAEAVVAVGRGGSRPGAVVAAAATALGLVGAAWISTGHRLAVVGATGWAAVAAGALVAAVRARPPAAPGGSRQPPAAGG